ncbi:MAG: hypothetical protein AVDCRST_MAG77-2078 [uncultured Chloroflexi bacterium]|uniref:ADP-heptose--lipooligosaccharide heptosyltransferase II n=1 Tax=uncultured Chloroflexota bacterium TaxID=166587 RepID=A0A6J4IFZ0_9CHLR|nr:MAG: hypothetical protein AVDCRST_MAG77-2078 [uncultured Chloroflexota bacterium]
MATNSAVGLPLNVAPDLAAAWDAMCAPVRERYAGSSPNRARNLALRWLRWEVRRREGQAAPASGAALRVDARILIVQPDHLGGVLASTPTFRLLKAALPTAKLTALVGPWGADVAERCPVVDRVRTCRFPAFDRAARPAGVLERVSSKLAPYTRLLDEAAALRGERFDVALVLAPDFWAAALVALACIPRRVGFATAEAEGFLTYAMPMAPPPIGKAPGPREPGAAAQLRLARVALDMAGVAAPERFDARMAYEPRPEERDAATRLWRAHDLDEAQGVVALHPTPGGAAKRWPAERWALVADHLSGRYGAQVVVTGGPHDVAEARALAAACTRRPVVLAGQAPFGALAALLERCRFVLGTDNGALHLATARGVPSLRLFGQTDASVWGGWTGGGEQGPVTVALQSPRLCSPCHRLDLPLWEAVSPGHGAAYPCMEDLTLAAVLAAVEDLWRRTAR